MIEIESEEQLKEILKEKIERMLAERLADSMDGWGNLVVCSLADLEKEFRRRSG